MDIKLTKLQIELLKELVEVELRKIKSDRSLEFRGSMITSLKSLLNKLQKE